MNFEEALLGTLWDKSCGQWTTTMAETQEPQRWGEEGGKWDAG